MHFPQNSFDEEQLSVLRTAFELVCTDLGIAKDDSETRNKVADAIMSMVRAGQFDLERLRVYATSRAIIR